MNRAKHNALLRRDSVLVSWIADIVRETSMENDGTVNLNLEVGVASLLEDEGGELLNAIENSLRYWASQRKCEIFKRTRESLNVYRFLEREGGVVMTTTRHETLRECIERGGRGEFAQALVAYYWEPTATNKRRVMAVADTDNAAAFMDAIVSAYDDVEALPNTPFAIFIRRHLRREFPGLRKLHEPCDNPHAISLRGEE